MVLQAEGKKGKIEPSNIAELLTPVALAYWVSGDGCLDKSRGMKRSDTHSFTVKEVDILRSALLKNLNVESARNTHNAAKEQYIIRIPKREVTKLQDIVTTHMPASMKYRAGL
jgi:hypothetical protein